MSTKKLGIIIEFGKRLKEWRENEGLSQAKLGELLGVAGVTIHEAENGANVGIKVVLGIAKENPNDLHWLLTGERPPTRIMEPGDNELFDAYKAADIKRRNIVQITLDLPVEKPNEKG